MNEIEEENDELDLHNAGSSSTNLSETAENGPMDQNIDSDGETEMVLEEDDIRNDEQDEDLVFEEDLGNELEIEEEHFVQQSYKSLIAKDGTTWLNDLPSQVIRTNAHNVFRGSAVGPTRATQGLIESELFELIITPTMLEQVLIDTNEKAQTTFQVWNDQNPTKPKEWSNVTMMELRAAIGLFLLAGVNKSSDEDIDVLWSSESICYYRSAMSKSRFKEILRFIRFDSQRTRAARLIDDKAAPISVLWEQMNSNLRKYYNPSGEITVDEQLFGYRGKTRFTQYIPSKPAKYGIKVWFACDANSFYPLNSKIYTGKNANESRACNVGETVVKSLVHHWEKSGRTIVCDNFFTSLSLGRHLMSKGLALLGTVRQNKTFVPSEMKPSRERVEMSSVFGFLESKFSLVSYVPRKGKAVILLSTTPLNNTVVSNVKNKPQYILDYNATQGGVDTMDKMVSSYTTKR